MVLKTYHISRIVKAFYKT